MIRLPCLSVVFFSFFSGEKFVFFFKFSMLLRSLLVVQAVRCAGLHSLCSGEHPISRAVYQPWSGVVWMLGAPAVDGCGASPGC